MSVKDEPLTAPFPWFGGKRQVAPIVWKRFGAVRNYGEAGTGPVLKPGTTLAIEPMITAGAYDIRIDDDGWSIFTTDGSLSAHFEHTVAITEEGPRVLTLVHGDSIVNRAI